VLNSKVAIVTGGTRGIGLAVARGLLAEGASVLVTGSRDESVASAAAALSALGPAEAMRADVRRVEDANAMVARAVERFGGLDILVNNAGVGTFANIADMTDEQWHWMFETNLTGVFYCTRAALPALKARGGGWVINVSSLAGKNAFVGGGAYCATKAGLNSFTEVLMQEVRHDNIRVTLVAPGSVATEFGDRPDPESEWKLSPDDLARTIVDLVKHPARSLPSSIEMRPSRPPKKK
jgi:3-oxoacyl-[acyl-carrier protein] reductase